MSQEYPEKLGCDGCLALILFTVWIIWAVIEIIIKGK
jgi:hypothetical protein